MNLAINIQKIIPKQLFVKLLLLYMVIQPVFDCIVVIHSKIYRIPSVRAYIIPLILIYILINYKNARKPIFIITILSALYFIGRMAAVQNAANLQQIIPFTFDLETELSSFRLHYFQLALIPAFYYVFKEEKEQSLFFGALYGTALLISFLVILPPLFGINNYTYRDQYLGQLGLFGNTLGAYFANSLSNFSAIIHPILGYGLLVKESKVKKIIKWVIYILFTYALLLIAMKSSVFGAILGWIIFGVMIAAHADYSKKQRFIYSMSAVLIAGVCFLTVITGMVGDYKEVFINRQEKKTDQLVVEHKEDDEKKEDFLRKKITDEQITYFFSLGMGNRLSEHTKQKLILDTREGKLRFNINQYYDYRYVRGLFSNYLGQYATFTQKLFGVGNSVVKETGFYPENQFRYEKTYIGILGLLLYRFPYLVMILLGMAAALRKIKSFINSLYIAFFASVGLSISIAYFAGWVFGTGSQSLMYLSAIYALFLLYTKPLERSSDKK